MEVLSELKNDLLKRKEVKIVITQNKNPSFDEATKFISEKFKAIEDTIKIKKIEGKYGSHNFIIKANIYDNKEDKNAIEPKTKQEKEAEAKAAEESAKPAEEASITEEKPAEEPKEEAPKTE